MIFLLIGSNVKFVQIGKKVGASSVLDIFRRLRLVPSMPALSLLLLGSLGLWLGMPNPVAQLPAAVLLYPICLFRLGQNAEGWGTALRRGWLCGLLGSSGSVYWIAVPVHDFGGLPWLLAVPCSLAVGAYLGVYGGLFAVLARVLRPFSPLRQAAVAGSAWFLLEWLRGWLCTGFPWLTLSAAFAPWPFLIQGAAAVGAFGLSGTLVFLTTLGAAGWSRGGSVRRRALSICVAGFVLLAAAGAARLQADPLARGTSVAVALVQGNVDQSIKWTRSVQEATVRRYLDLTSGALVRRPDIRLAVWPETAMPFDFERHAALSAPIETFALRHNTGILLGAVGQAGAEDLDHPEPLLFNRAYLVAPLPHGALAPLSWYEKEHLVPFGEYLPPGLDFPFLRPLLQEVGNFTPARTAGPLRLPSRSPADHGDSGTVPAAGGVAEPPLVLGVLICYETLFPELARRRAADGAELFVNISNDAWFGRTSAPEQHLQLTLLRAVEQGRYLVRATNTGVSAFIDPYGRRLKSGGLFKAETLTADVAPMAEHTLFFHLFPWLPPGAVLIMLLGLRGAPLRNRTQGCRVCCNSPI